MHKSPGEKEEKLVIIDLRKSEATAVMNFVLVESMLFDRLSKLYKNPTLRLRLGEENRLKALAVTTLCQQRRTDEGSSDSIRGALYVDTLATIGKEAAGRMG